VAGSTKAVFVIWVLQRLILEVHGVMCLIVQESLAFEKVLSPLEGTLLLHLLETVLIILQDLASILVRECLLIYCVLIFEVWRTVMVAKLGVRACAPTRWASVSEWDTVDVVPNDWAGTWSLLAAGALSSGRHVDVHVATVSDWRRAVSVDAVSFGRFIFAVKVHLFF